MHRRKRVASIALTSLAFASLAAAPLPGNAGLARADSGNAYGLTGNTPGLVARAKDTGPVDPSTVISVSVWLKLHNENQLDQLVQRQYQKGSAQFHKWLTQDQFNASYAPSSQEVNAVQNFLSAHNLSVLTVAENNFYIKVQGTVGDIEKAFHVQIDSYSLNGVTYRSNTGNPTVNDAAGGNIAAITGMDDVGFQPAIAYPGTAEGTTAAPVPLTSSPKGVFFEGQCFRGTETHTFADPANSITATYSGNRYGADPANTALGHIAPCGYSPAELQTAYNLTPLYNSNLAGQGQTIVITDAFGDPTIQQDAEVFSQIYGLPDLTSANFQIYRAPGAVNNPVDNGHIGPGAGWTGEITLDVEWAHAMAPLAKIALVIGPNNGNDLDEAINYAVVHHLGNTISNSWSSVEGFGNPARLDRDNRILEQAAAEGIDVNFSSGDSGDFAATFGFKTVGFPSSSPFATGVGGTSLALNPDNSIAFQTGWGTNLTKIARKGGTPLSTPLNEGFIYGAGGGASLTFAKPAWQTAPGATRMVPDISMVADPYTGVEIVQTVNGQLSVGVIGGTSLACPIFSAIMAIASQKAGQGLGQAAPLLYNLPAGAVTDVTNYASPTNVSGSVTTPAGTTNYSADQLVAPLNGTTGYYSAFYNSPFSGSWFTIAFGTDSSLTTGPGWDDVTGVGTPNGANFVNALAP